MMIPYEAKFILDYSPSHEASYLKFLQAKQFERSVRYAIDRQTRELIASAEQLEAEGTAVIEGSIDRNFDVLSHDLEKIEHTLHGIKESNEESLKYLDSTLHWGFSELFASIGHANDSLKELIKIARSPSQTWSYEQYETARDEFRRHLYPEALSSLRRAIDGFGSNAGLRTEFRFHLMLGAIRLGDFRNADPAVVDPSEAESAFTHAARYAAHQYPVEAGHALVNAGRAAFIQQKIPEAIRYTEDSLKFIPDNGVALFQLSRLFIANNSQNEAEENLYRAILVDWKFSMAAASLSDFLDNREILESAISRALLEYEKRACALLENFSKNIDRIMEFSFEGITINSLITKRGLRLDPGVDLGAILKHSEAEIRKKTLLGYANAMKIISQSRKLVDSLWHTSKNLLAKYYQNTMIAEIEKDGNMAKMNIAAPTKVSKGDIMVRSVVLAIFLHLGVIGILVLLRLPSIGVPFFVIPSPIWIWFYTNKIISRIQTKEEYTYQQQDRDYRYSISIIDRQISERRGEIIRKLENFISVSSPIHWM